MPRTGRPRTPTATLEARGSWRAKARKKAERPKPPSRPEPPKFRALKLAEVEALVREVPGFDPFKNCDGCWLDHKPVNRVLRFFAETLCHVEGAVSGKPFRLERWQQAVMANLFGWRRWNEMGEEVRRFRESLIYVPRKNGKTPWAAGIALFVLFEDDEPGQQDYIAAATREQAGKLFRYAKAMTHLSPELSNGCRVYGGTAQAGQSKSIVKMPEETSFLQVIAAEGGQHGGTSHLIIVDELHEQPNRDLVDTLITSMASANRKQPLMLYTTTADFMRPSVCNEKYDYACKVRDGVVADQGFLPVIYETTAKDNWASPEVWAKANPNLGVSVSREYLDREFAKAKDDPEYENTFKRLHLNLRTDADVRAIPSVLWDANGAAFDPAVLDGRDCYAGLDLANTLDVAALAKVFPPLTEGEDWHALFDFWVPEAAARERQKTNRARYDAWISKGHMHRTEGDVIDYTAIRSKLAADAERYRVVKLMFDPWNATQFAQELQDQDGFVVEKFLQTLANFNEPWKRLMELLKEGRFRHGGQPVLRWMAGNVSVHTDGRGYKMPSRKKSGDKIDGVVALLMGLAPALGATTTKATVEVW